MLDQAHEEETETLLLLLLLLLLSLLLLYITEDIKSGKHNYKANYVFKFSMLFRFDMKLGKRLRQVWFKPKNIPLAAGEEVINKY